MSDNTGKDLTRRELRQLISTQYTHRTGRQLTPQQITKQADIIETVREELPNEIRDAMEKPTPYTPIQGEIVYLRSNTECIAASYERPYGNSHLLKHVLIDTVGKTHIYTTTLTAQGYHIIPAARWIHPPKDEREEDEEYELDIRIMGPIDRSFPLFCKWKIGSEALCVNEMTIKLMTRAITYAKMQPPSCEKKWEERLGKSFPWLKIWRIKSFFTTPRDEVTWLKIMHRNLWVANRDPTVDPKCRAPGCSHDESMLHLAECRYIATHYWDKVKDILLKLRLPVSQTPEFLILGILPNNKIIGKAQAGIMFLAWRCCYAEIVGSRIEDRRQNWRAVFKRLLGMIISRLKAYGLKWYRWHSKRRFNKKQKKKIIPIKYRDRKLITSDAIGNYKINQILITEYAKA